jgi:ABC-type multidrug transport system permease subunit
VKAFLVLARMRVLDVLRSRSSAIYFLVAPVVILLVVALIFINGQPFERRHVALVAPGAPAALSGFRELALEPAPDENAARGRIRSRAVSAAIVAEGAGWKVIAGSNDGLFARGLASALPPPVAIETVSLPRWSYVHYVFPGVLTVAVLVAGLYGMGFVMARWRQNLFLKKLATTPLGKGTFIAAQVAARSVLILAQMVLLVAAAALVLDLPVSALGLALLGAFTVVGLVTFMGLGFLLACTIRSDELLSDVVNGLLAPMILCSDMFFPITELPGPLAAAAALLPTTQLVRAARAILLEGTTDLGALGPPLGLLAAWLVLTYAVSLLLFRWHD